MEQLGLDARLLVTQVINFLILLALLGKFVYKPIIKLMEDRRKRIEQGLELAKTMEEEREKLDQRAQEILDKAEERATRVLSKAREEAEVERERIIEEARREAQTVIEEGLRVLSAKQEEAQERMRKEVAELVVALSEKFLSEKIDKKKHKEIIEKQIEELSKRDVSKVH